MLNIISLKLTDKWLFSLKFMMIQLHYHLATFLVKHKGRLTSYPNPIFNLVTFINDIINLFR
jgi:hypothetical protein